MAQDFRRGVTACAFCHRKKVRCVFQEGITACLHCQRYGHPCRPHVRKRAEHSSSSLLVLNSQPPTNDMMSLAEASNTSAVAMRELQTVSSKASEPQIATSQTYLGRSGYLRGDVPFMETMEDAQRDECPSRLSPSLPNSPYVRSDSDHLLPSRSIRASLIDTFMERCHPWMPIVERPWLEENEKNPPSMLLLNAVFLVGSRVSRSETGSISPQIFYERARRLFFHGSERNAVLVVVAACLLNWWSPTGPEQISLNTSGFWVSVGAFLAYQVGLHIDPGQTADAGFRRRLWWSLRVSSPLPMRGDYKEMTPLWQSRDNLISVAVGRPRIINAKETDVRPISLDDFHRPDTRARLFCAYAPICTLIGDIAEAHRLRALSNHSRSEFEHALLQWARAVSPQLRIFRLERGRPLSSYNNEAWQLWVPYLVCLLILQRTSNPKSSNSTACFLASSLIAGIFEDFLSRDHVKHLPPVWAFYALAAGLCQLTGYRYVSLREIAEQEIHVICQALEKLKERWGSAKSALNSLTRAIAAVTQQVQVDVQPEPLSPSMVPFFDHFGPSLCRMWHLLGLDGSCFGDNVPMNTQLQPTSERASENTVFDWAHSLQTGNHETHIPDFMGTAPINGANGQGNALPAEFDDMFPMFETSIHPMGSWFFESFDMVSAGMEARQATII